jgi:hypothetical protein
MTQGVKQMEEPPPENKESPVEVPVALTTRPEGALSFHDALESPCLTCSTSPCCTYLLVLQQFPLRTLLDVDHARYLLNFDGIIAGLTQDGVAEFYFRQNCRYLDVPSGMCTVHETPDQPAICVHYNAYSCMYRHRMTVEVDPERPLLDRHRLAWYTEHLSFDDARRVVATPTWDEVIEAFHAMPLERDVAPPPPPDPVVEEWRSITLSTKGARGAAPGLRRVSEPEVSNPCQGCGAWCCKTLIFGREAPKDAGQLDFLRYCLGFPGVELGIGDDGWAIVVRTTCRHLVDNKCSVFGTEERPLKCGYFDALGCKYRIDFGTPRPEGLVRINYAQFGALANAIVFDDLGRIIGLPTVQVLRERVENAERSAAASTRVGSN